MKFKLYKNSEIFVICPANIGWVVHVFINSTKLKKKFKKSLRIISRQLKKPKIKIKHFENSLKTKFQILKEIF